MSIKDRITPMENAQYYAERLSDDDGTATVLEINGTDITFKYDDGVEQFVGTLHDGESLADIVWQLLEQGE
jgi:hypothetical protein